MSILSQLVKPSVRLAQRRALPASLTAYSTANGPFDTLITTEKGPEVADTALPVGSDVPKEIHWTELKWSEMSRNSFASLKAKPVPDAFTGRQVRINNSNVLAAFAKLSGILKTNNVMHELRKTKRHEKKGVKRRRLESETWRRVFAHEVRRNVQLVAKIRSRGA